MLGGASDDVHGLCAREAHELRRLDAHDVPIGTGARPDELAREERAVDEHGVHGGQRGTAPRPRA